MTQQKHISIGHGAGGSLSNTLIQKVILKYFKDRTLQLLEDAAVLKRSSRKLVFTTDGYVIHPIFFPGGDIGKLAVCGTINDLAMKGAFPEYLSFSMIIEERFPIADLERILRSAARTAQRAGVTIVCGDTKVVEKGSADKLFITTSGIGILRMNVGNAHIRVGDKIIVSGTIGDHGIALINERLDLGLRSSIQSDCAPLNLLTRTLLRHARSIHCMRDPTRGGVASVLNETIGHRKMGIMLEQNRLPIRKQVIGASEMLGIDPLYIANEGKLIAFVAPQAANRILKRMHQHPYGRDAAIIGEVVRKPHGVWIRTSIGGTHPLLLLEAEGLPRIC
jgi:hydrogenase expression/formation protein HypE